MREEASFFYRDVREKTVTGRSARRLRTHCGRRGPVRLPPDCLTEKQRQALNGACRVYRLGQDLDWDSYRQMPREHRITYLRRLRQNLEHREIAERMGAAEGELARELEELGLK